MGRLVIVDRRSPHVLVRSAALAGIAWLLVLIAFTFAYRNGGGTGAYLQRDDGIITLSHARGLVDVGTVSVGANGARVEGFSAPLQFAAAVPYFAAGGTDPGIFMFTQVAFTTVLLGAAAFVFVAAVVPRRSLRAQIAAASLVSVPVFASFRFFGWHLSGMENSITNALVASSLALLAVSLRRSRWLWCASVVTGLLAVTRDEFVVHAFALLLVMAVLLARRGAATRRRLVALFAPAALLWTAVQIVRVWYFGSLVPNSGAAQRIEPVDNILGLLAVVWPLVAGGVAAAVAWKTRRRPDARSWQISAACIGVVGLGASAWLMASSARTGTLDAVLPTFAVLGALPWFFALAILLLLSPRRLIDAEWLPVTMLASAVGHVLVFGQARLSGERVVSFVMVPLACLLATFILEWDPARALQRLQASARIGAAALACGAFALLAVVGRLDAYAVTTLCCDVTPTARSIETVADSVRRANGLSIVRVANPDLGALSLRKAVDVVDLGYLGDPLLTRLWNDTSHERAAPAVVVYLNEVARPDVIEIHGHYACDYAAWLRSTRFHELYRKLSDDGWTKSWLRAGCDDPAGASGGVWERRDLAGGFGSPELELARVLITSPKVGVVERAIDQCAADQGPWRCQWVTRAILRNQRFLDDRGVLGAMVAALRRAPTWRYDDAILSSRSRGDWYVDASDALKGFLSVDR